MDISLFFDRMVSASPTSALLVDRDLVIRACNDAFAAAVALPKSNILNRPMRDLVGPEIAGEAKATIHRAIEHHAPRRLVGMWRGRWTAGLYTPVRVNDADYCFLAAQPWLSPVPNAETLPHIPTEEMQATDLADLTFLSAREGEVLWWLAQDKSVPQIARALSRSAKTIECHIRALTAKTGRSGRLALAQFAHERGIAHMTLDQARRVFSTKPAKDDADALTLAAT